MIWTKLSDAIDASKRSVATISYDSTVPVPVIEALVEKRPPFIDSIIKLSKVLKIGAFDLLGMDAFCDEEAELIDDALADYEKSLRAELNKPGKIDEAAVRRINDVVALRAKMK